MTEEQSQTTVSRRLVIDFEDLEVRFLKQKYTQSRRRRRYQMEVGGVWFKPTPQRREIIKACSLQTYNWVWVEDCLGLVCCFSPIECFFSLPFPLASSFLGD